MMRYVVIEWVLSPPLYHCDIHVVSIQTQSKITEVPILHGKTWFQCESNKRITAIYCLASLIFTEDQAIVMIYTH